MEADLKLVPAKCGCEGCYFEDKFDCPGDEEKDFVKCSENGTQMIFVKSKEQNDE